MENIFTLSDSGLETTGMLESLNSHKDITLTDVSLSESTLHDLVVDEAGNSQESLSSPTGDRNLSHRLKFANSQSSSLSGTSLERDLNGLGINKTFTPREMLSGKSSKEEKQRQNEEIVILESSSLSSETGSWESVFPPKLAEKDICERFISTERQFCVTTESNSRSNADTIETSVISDDLCPSLVQKSPFKSTSCFIDAASLVDEEDETIKVQTDFNPVNEGNTEAIPAPSQPLPCSTVKLDLSPNDWSESNDNEDSLEQADNKDPDSIQKDLSPTIFEMTPITEDSLTTNAFENAALAEQRTESPKTAQNDGQPSYNSFTSSTCFISSTPYNSIMSLQSKAFKYESDDSETNTTTVSRESHANIKKLLKYNEASPIISGGASIEDHLPQLGSSVSSPLTKRRIENIPIVSGAYISKEQEPQEKAAKGPSNASSWVVDMSSSPKSEESGSGQHNLKRPGDRTCENLRNTPKSACSVENCIKSRSSVDSDSSEKSSHKFYIDLSSLPDPLPPEKNDHLEDINEKKNLFSMFIDLGEKSTVKEMPPRLLSSLNPKKSVDNKTTNKKNINSAKPVNDHHVSLTTFEKLESLCNDPNLTISEIIAKPVKKDNAETMKKDKLSISVGNADRTLIRNLNNVIKEEEPLTHGTSDLFVKLSDLDKPAQKLDTTFTITENKVLDVRMTRSIPENNWGEQGLSAGSRSIDVFSSFHSENALSLNRLFPHLKNDFSKSMPGSLSSRTRSPLRSRMSPEDIEDHASDNISEVSSVHSSACRSVVGTVENSTTEETSQTSSLIGNCQSRLGQDLLRMFLEEIAPDVIVEVSGRRIKAHKCILSSRCQYFAGILSGGWVESAGNVISLPPFSFSVVHFALCHIYSGVSMIPDSISIVELSTLADMLGLEGLKEAIMFTLKAKYCHHFHKPCNVCTAGVLECFPLSSVYGLDDLYRKCLKWITKHFSKVWPTKAFATLPTELLDKCYQQQVVNLTTETLMDTVFGCGLTVASLQNSRWAESVACMCQKLVNAAAHFASSRLRAVFESLATCTGAPPAAAQALDDCLTAAIGWAPPEEACRAYSYLSALLKESRPHYSKPDLIANGSQAKGLIAVHAVGWRLRCEGALVRAAPRVVTTQAFKEMPPELRKRLRELGCIMYGTQAIPVATLPVVATDRRSRSAYNGSSGARLDVERACANFVPYALRPQPAPQEHKPRACGPPRVRTTKAQEERAKFNMYKNQSQDRLNCSKPAPRAFENTKPRYLEDRKAPRKPKIASSSESLNAERSVSNSSPVQPRHAMSRDSLASGSRPRTADPNTDSLSDKYATYTKRPAKVPDSVECKGPINGRSSKTKTKIPVYQNQKSINGRKPATAPVQKRTIPEKAPNIAQSKPFDRKVPGSLMNATKSSSAKMVPKIVKDKGQNQKASKQASRQIQPPEIPAMDRSGTFLKDEPTFGDKTTNIDIGQ